jgi:hypothetical protein
MRHRTWCGAALPRATGPCSETGAAVCTRDSRSHALNYAIRRPNEDAPVAAVTEVQWDQEGFRELSVPEPGRRRSCAGRQIESTIEPAIPPQS